MPRGRTPKRFLAAAVRPIYRVERDYPCLLCSRAEPGPDGRCATCGGSMLGQSRLVRDYAAEAALEPDDPPAPPCAGAGEKPCPRQARPTRSTRCRPCYLRHRYHSNAEIRARQLALQAEWRARQPKRSAAS